MKTYSFFTKTLQKGFKTIIFGQKPVYSSFCPFFFKNMLLLEGFCLRKESDIIK